MDTWLADLLHWILTLASWNWREISKSGALPVAWMGHTLTACQWLSPIICEEDSMKTTLKTVAPVFELMCMRLAACCSLCACSGACFSVISYWDAGGQSHSLALWQAALYHWLLGQSQVFFSFQPQEFIKIIHQVESLGHHTPGSGYKVLCHKLLFCNVLLAGHL